MSNLASRMTKLEAQVKDAKGCFHCRGVLQIKLCDSTDEDQEPNFCTHCGFKGMVVVVERSGATEKV